MPQIDPQRSVMNGGFVDDQLLWKKALSCAEMSRDNDRRND
jgi:hypothetical protein